MMNFIIAPVIVGIIALCIYRLFELFVRRKERLLLIEKLHFSERIPEYDLASMLTVPGNMPIFEKSSNKFTALKIGSLLAGMGIGLLVAFFIYMNYANDLGSVYASGNTPGSIISGLYGASTLLFGGIGLIVAFVIELRFTSSKKA
ncbi:MAG: DUF6249 domain-containing protein [Bacteroidales bacterium]